MNLQIRDPKAHELARKLAEKRRVSMTEAVIGALEPELRRERLGQPLAERLVVILRQAQGAGSGSNWT